MSEPSDEALQAFFLQEGVRDEERVQVSLLGARLQQIIVDALDIRGADHIWAFDQEAFRAAVVQAARTMVDGQQAATYDEAVASVAERVVDETTIVTSLLKVLATKELGLPLEDEAKQKKRLEVLIGLRGFTSGWADAVNDLLAGDRLDLGREEDLQLYVDTAMTLEHPEPGSIHAEIREIFSDPVRFNDPRRAMLPIMLMQNIETARYDQTRLPDVEAYITEQAQEGAITLEEKQRLLALLHRKED